MIDFARARAQMVEGQLRAGGVHTLSILASMRAVPRERFVPESRRPLAYADMIHWYDGPAPARFMAPPLILARLLGLAEITPDDTVLDLGAATGYSTAVIARLAAAVTALEPDAGLAAAASANLAALGLDNARVIAGGIEQLDGAAFDVIVVQGSLDSVPDALFSALNEGGRLVALVNAGSTGVAQVFVKAAGKVTARSDFNARLPPLFSGVAEDEFIF